MQNLSKLFNLRQLKSKNDQSYQVAVDIDRLLKSLQDQNTKQKKQRINISEKQFITLCRITRSLLLKQPSLLRLNGPIYVATGTVGYYKDLANIFSRCGHPDLHNYLFIGDYVGRGERNIQCLTFLMCLKIKLQNNFFMLRGCHDSIAMARSFGFYDQCLERFTPKAFTQACQFLCSLPFAAVIQNQIFCCHGGLSPQLRSVQDINRITRPIQTPEIGLACDLVWADPSYKQDSLIWCASERGFSYNFHDKVVHNFLKQNKLSLLCRGHEVVYDGFYMNREKTIATICSLANYGGMFNNSAAVLVLNPQYQAYFKVIRQRQHFPIQSNFHDSAQSLLKKKIQQKRQKKRKQQQQKTKKQQQINKNKPIQQQNQIPIQQKLKKQEGQTNKIKVKNKGNSQNKDKNKMNIIEEQQQIKEKQSAGSQQDQEYVMKMKVLKKEVEAFYISENYTDIVNNSNTQDYQQARNHGSSLTDSDDQQKL